MKLHRATADRIQADAARTLAADLAADGWQVSVEYQPPNAADSGFRWDLYAQKDGETPRVYEFVGVRSGEDAEKRAAQAARYAKEQGVRLFLKQVKEPAASRTDFERVIKRVDEIRTVLEYAVNQAVVERALITYAVIACSNLVEELLLPVALESENRRAFSLVEAARLAVAKGAISQKSYQKISDLQTMRNRLVHSNDLWDISKDDAWNSVEAVNLLTHELTIPMSGRGGKDKGGLTS